MGDKSTHITDFMRLIHVQVLWLCIYLNAICKKDNVQNCHRDQWNVVHFLFWTLPSFADSMLFSILPTNSSISSNPSFTYIHHRVIFLRRLFWPIVPITMLNIFAEFFFNDTQPKGCRLLKYSAIVFEQSIYTNFFFSFE